jgi:uncharacterized protein YbjT (DUF2867 family)
MTNRTITLAGATGDLGGRIATALAKRGSSVRALVRVDTSAESTQALRRANVELRQVSFDDPAGLTAAVAGSSCVVSVLSGLQEVIVGVQTRLLRAVEAARVPRFIPSDFSCDLTHVPPGENRNFDLRRAFHREIDASSVHATSILNGAFADMLTWKRSPLYDFARHQVMYWGSPDQWLDFTTMDDVADFTAAAAMDSSSPRFLRIAGNSVSARDLAAVASEVFGVPYEIALQGSLDDLAERIRTVRDSDPNSESSVFPPFQGMQYLHNMFSGKGKLEPLDNDRYPDVRWTTIGSLLEQKKDHA